MAERSGEEPGLTFPDAPRLELDELLAQLVARAQEVMATQDRLRGLLHANQMIIGDLALPVLLRRIVAAARELVGARYAALGVIAPDGHLAEFVHDGMAEQDVAAIGQLPQGKGLLGALIEDPQPIRLSSIGDDPRSSGFPPGHPPMRSFLGVPIRIREEVFGNLYLAESTKGDFTAEDEELSMALAATAAAAIENSRLYEAARSRGEWLQASAAITRRLLSADLGDPVQFIAERTREIAGADVVCVVLPDGGGELRVTVVVGTCAEDLVGLAVPLDGSLAGRVFTTGEPLRVATPDERPGLTPVAAGGLDLGPVLVVPLVGSQQINGVLTAARSQGRPAFTAEDLDMAAGFANHASVAVELAEARAEQQRAAMLDERDRIAADLHDHVIQRLFAAGMSLQGVAGGLGPGSATDRILGTIDDLDATISQIRTTIFQLRHVSGAAGSGVRTRLLEVAADAARPLGFEPTVRFAGPLESSVSEEFAEDLLAVLREALSNVARHAGARAADVDVTVDGGWLVLDVRDDGTGIPPTTRPGADHRGLANLLRRAERHGGTLELRGREPQGTWLRWTVPLR